MAPRGFLLIALAALSTGCGNGERPCFPVSGSVAVAGRTKPPAGARVYFHPVQPLPDQVGMPAGEVDADGRFSLTTKTTGDGAPEGEYIITIVWPAPVKSVFDGDGGDLLGGRFADPKRSPWRFTVRPDGPNIVPAIELLGKSD